MIKSKNESKKNGMWKGDKAGLDAIHIWVLRRKPKPKVCEDCKKKPPLDLANISQKYKRDVNDFEWLCRKCHMTKDGRLKKLIRIRTLKEKQCEMCDKTFQPVNSKSILCSLSCAAYKANKKRWGFEKKRT